MKKGKRRIEKKQRMATTNYYSHALKELTKLDPDFRFERACCGERTIRERYSVHDLNHQIGSIQLAKLTKLSPYVLGAAGHQTTMFPSVDLNYDLGCIQVGSGPIQIIENYDLKYLVNP